MASLPVKDEGGSGALGTILGSSVKPKLQSLDSPNPAGVVPTDTGLPHRRRPLPPEKSGVQSIHRLLSLKPVATLSPPAGQFLINTLLQAAGFAAAIAFGIYAVKSVKYADQAVQQAVTANQLAILAVCLSNGTQTADIASICFRVVSGAASVLPNAASMLFPNLPTPTSTASPTNTASTASQPFTTPTATLTPPSPSASSTGSGVTIGIVVGAIMGVILLSIIFYVMIRVRRRRHAAAPTAAPTTSGPGALDVEADSPMSGSRGIVKVFRKLFVDSQVISHME